MKNSGRARSPKGRGPERRQFEAFVRSLFVPRSEEALRQAISANILKIVPGQNAVIHTLELRQRTVRPILPTHPFSRVFLEGIKAFIHEHPSFREAGPYPRYRERLISDFVSTRQWHRMALYNEAYHPEGLEDQIGIRVCPSGTSCTGVAVLRDKRGSAQKDRQRMSVLASYFDRAFSNVRELEKLRLSLEQCHAQLDAAPYGMIRLDEQRNVLAVNRRAETLLLEFFPREHTARLPSLVKEWLRPTARDLPMSLHRVAPLIRYSDKARLVIRPMILPEQESLLLVLQRRSLRPNLEDLVSLGLTRRESEVLLWVALGKTNEEIARVLGGSRRTIDKHVQNLLLKLQLENRAGAILLVSDLLHS